MTDAARDARFRDAEEGPLRLRALDAEDLRVVAALAQDAVVPLPEMSFLRRARRFAALVNRFRWEAGARAPERVRTMLVVENATAVRSQGVPREDPDLVLSILDVTYEGEPEGPGQVVLTLAGDGLVAVEVEALEVTLTDVTRPYLAPSRRAPSHPD